jgi:CO/xanthine dehydrogenase FAD-binding subunit
MIPFGIEYLRPTRAQEAAVLYREASEAGKEVRYLSGGTELVTMARDGKVEYDVLIDLKRIPETTVLDLSTLTFGSALRLSDLRDHASGKGAVGLVGQAAGGVADRTTRNSITLGGNVCGMLPYREALLPFLLLDGEATLMGADGSRRVPVTEIFNKRMQFQPGEYLVSLHLGEHANQMAGFYERRTREPQVDYPLMTLCIAEDDAGFRFTVGGAFGPPVRSLAAEEALNGRSDPGAGSPGERRAAAARAVASFEESARTDMRGSAEYRADLLEQSLARGLAALGAGA